MTQIRSTLANISSVAASDIINRGFFFLFNIVVARNIAPEAFGYYALSISIGIWFWSLADGGLTSHGIKLVAQGADPEVLLGRVIGTRLILLAAAALVYSGLIFSLEIAFVERITYLAVLLYVFAMSLFPSWVARGKHDNTGYALSYMYLALCGVSALLLLLFSGFPYYSAGAIAARNGAWLMGSVIALFFITRRYECRLSLGTDFRTLRQTLPLGGAAVAYTLIPLMPFVAMRLYGWTEELGQYGVLLQIQQILLVGAGVLPVVLLPTYSKALAGSDKPSQRGIIYHHFVIVLVLSLVAGTGYFLAGPLVIEILFGEAYRNVATYLTPFVVALVLAFFRLSIDAVLIANGIYKRMLLHGVLVLLIVFVVIFVACTPEELVWAYCMGEALLAAANGKAAMKYLLPD